MQEVITKNHSSGWLNGFIGVFIFAGSLPATRAAVLGFDPFFLTAARAVIAGILSLAILYFSGAPKLARHHVGPLIIVALGVVVGFPLFSAIALLEITSAYSLVYIGLLPLMTALFAVLRAKECPKPAFWLFSFLGSMLVAGFALTQGASGTLSGDLLMLLSVIVCGLGYAEGGRLSRELGGSQVICWALVIALPVMLPFLWFTWPATFDGIPVDAWIGLGYVSIFSMLIGFIFWYRGLAQGGIASVGQLQLLQPFFGLALAATLLHEQVSLLMIAATFGVILCVAGSKRYA